MSADETTQNAASAPEWDGTTPGALDWAKLDRETIRRWRSEAVTAPAQERLWLNRCEALCNALLHVQARLEADRG